MLVTYGTKGVDSLIVAYLAKDSTKQFMKVSADSTNRSS